MNITIDNKDYELKFGLKFIRELDKNHSQTEGGVTFGTGVQYAVGFLHEGNPIVLPEVIKAALAHTEVKPNDDAIDTWVESQDDLEKVFTDFLEQLKTTPVTKRTALKTLAAIEKAQAEA